MAKKAAVKKALESTTKNPTDGAAPRVNKSAAIREYLKANKGAMPKDVSAALKAKGINVSPQVVSMIKSKMKIKKAQRRADRAVASNDPTAGAQTNRVAGLDAALLLYKAAQGVETPVTKVREAFLLLVETLG